MHSRSTDWLGRSSLMLRLLLLAILSHAMVIAAVETRAEVVKIGLVAPIKGPRSSLGAEMRQAAVDAVQVINDAGGLFGERVELVIADDACSRRQARQVANNLIKRVHVDAVIGHCPDIARNVAKVYEASETIFISLFTSNMDFGDRFFQYVFHLGVSEDRLGEAAANAIADEMTADRVSRAIPASDVGVVRDGSRFSKIVTSALEGQLITRGVKIAFNKAVKAPSTLVRLQERTQAKVLFFVTDDPTFVLSILGEESPRVTIVTLGMPSTPDRSWDLFWKWVDTNAAEAFVVAPAALGGEFPGSGMYLFSPMSQVRHLWWQRPMPPSISQIYVVTAFDLLAQAIAETRSRDANRLDGALRNVERVTLLGSLRSGETGEIKPMPYRMYDAWQRWKPSSAFLIECCPPKMAKMAKLVEERPVYNIEIDPKKSSDPLILEPDKKTKVTFYIGPQALESVTKGIAVSPTVDALAAGQPLQLTVTLFCFLSEADTYQQRKIIYDPKARRSTAADFEILPSQAAVRDGKGLGDLIFTIDADGMELDTIKVQAIVGDPLQEARAMYRPPMKIILNPLVPEEISRPDIIIDIASKGDGNLPVAIRPILPELRERLTEELGEVKEESWVFESGLTKNDLEGRVVDAYKTLRTIAEQNSKDLQRYYSHIGVDVEMSPGAARLHFSDKDTEKILKEIRRVGALLYWHIFSRGEKRLSRAVNIIDTFDWHRPLRLRIKAAHIYVPWQIFYPDFKEPIVTERFWGFRYELGTVQLVDAAQGRLRTVMAKLQPKEVLFGAWRGKDRKDDVAERATMLAKHLKDKVGEGIAFSDRKSDFLSRIEHDAKTIKLVFAYGHGSSGTEIETRRSESGEPVSVTIATDWRGPCFIFANEKDEVLVPRDLDSLTAKYFDPDELDPSFFKSQPIFILNACETGTAGARTPDNNGFVGALTRMGARAIFVTEGPVWNNFAYHFGMHVIDELFLGVEARRALRNVRLRHLREWKNPLGLLYSLYGNPAAQIEPD